jgi:hypothetical protein
MALRGTAGKPSNWQNMKPLGIENSGIAGIANRHGYRVEQLPQSLFDLDRDLPESQDLSSRHAGLVAEMLALAEDFRGYPGDSARKQAGSGTRPAGQAEPAGR